MQPLKALTYGVIGNTAVFGSAILGSSPSRSTKQSELFIFFEGLFFCLLRKGYIQSLSICIQLSGTRTVFALYLELDKIG